MAQMVKINMTPEISCNEQPNLEKVFQGLTELEYSPRKIKTFTESFDRAGLMAVHLSSCDRWEKLFARISFDSSSLVLTELTQFDNSIIRKSLSISDLQFETCYAGHELFGTLCVQPFTSVTVHENKRLTAVNCLLEDKFGRVVRIMVYCGGVEDYVTCGKADRARFRRGVAIVVKDPYLTRDDRDNGLLVYVEDFSRVSVVNGSRVPSALDVNASRELFHSESTLVDAIAFYNLEDWFNSIELHSLCIRKCRQELRNSKSNGMMIKNCSESLPGDHKHVTRLENTLLLAYSGRSATWLEMKNYERALSDANKALKLASEGNHSIECHIPKNLFLKGCALLALERYQEASKAFGAALKRSPQDLSILQAFQRSQAYHEAYGSELPDYGKEDSELASDDFKMAYEQSNRGDFDLTEYFLSDETIPPPLYGNYVGPVEIRSVENAGRGLFLKEPVVPGQLLLVSEALAMVSRKPKSLEAYVHALPLISPDVTARGRINIDIQEELVTQIAIKMASSVKLLHQVYSLADGSGIQNKVIPDVSIFLPPYTDPVDATETAFSDDDDINITILRAIVSENAISSKKHASIGPLVGVEDWGVWLLPSFINHSCHPNAHKIRVEDFMLVRASRHLSAGTEITLSYFDILKSVDVREDECASLGFICICNRCLFERSLPSCFDKIKMKVIGLLEMALDADDEFCSYSEAPQSLLKLACLAESIEQIMFSFSMTDEERNWLRASIIDPYLACSRLTNYELQKLNPSKPEIRRVTRMALLADAITTVNPGDKMGLKFSAHLLHEVGHEFGWESSEYVRQEVRVMKIYQTFYGISDTEVLRKLIAKVRLVY